MERFIRFSDYDIWAYLSSGILTIAAWDFAFGTSWVLKADWSPSDGTLIVFAAYIIGQILATPSSWLLERRLVGMLLHSPATNLFAESQTGWRKVLKLSILSEFYAPLDANLQKRIRERSGDSITLGQPLFWHAYAIAKRDPTAYPRMGTFLNQYGFCRNIAFVGFLSAAFNFAAIPCGQISADQLLAHSAISFAGGVMMFHRFLKFYRLYAVEVFVAYAEGGEK